MGARRTGRVIAFQTVFSWEANDITTEELLKFEWLDPDEPQNSQTAVDFARLLAAGTVENIHIIDKTIKEHLVNWKFNRLSKVDLAILRISVYSLLYRDEIPQKVTIDEAVDIAKSYGNDESYKFVNGVLDSIRKKNE
ncbi:MAG: transcription antitermination factor NusB [Spirochaetales bacterium]|uniref:Transcription antitermination protein NusB n=1 Tax=Candidatus Thalassospirochaeta sargassi TaxID=3119039 RepID=A0AAJ1MJ92_9SPIO|nr:transcription antitermination factor NusB [Spirochaetales bacterium]